MNSILYLGGFELPDKNAAAQRVLANAKLLRELGWDVSFIGISKDIDNAPSEVYGFKSFAVSYPTCFKSWVYQILTFIDTKRILAQRPRYVILYNFPSVASLRILHFCHRNGIKVIADLTEWEEPKGWSFRSIIRKMDVYLRMNYCIKKMDGVIAISRYLHDIYINYTNTILVPPTVDLQDPKWNRSESKHKYRENINLVYAGDAGSGTKDRLDYIIEALKGISNISFTVIGLTEEQYKSKYNKSLTTLIDIDFRGRISHKEAIDAVKAADFQMLIRENSRKNKAGFPTKLVESMACGTPVIATLTSNIGDYLKDGYNSLIVSERRSLREVFKEISKMGIIEIEKMKKNCTENFAFDYHNYASDFSQLFKQ